MELEQKESASPVEQPLYDGSENYNSSHSGLPPPPGTEPVVLPTQSEYLRVTEHSDSTLENISG